MILTLQSQARAPVLIMIKTGCSDKKAFFAVCDGHGSLGHEVSSFLIQELPKFFLKQPNLDANPHDAITKAFIGQTAALPVAP